MRSVYRASLNAPMIRIRHTRPGPSSRHRANEGNVADVLRGMAAISGQETLRRFDNGGGAAGASVVVEYTRVRELPIGSDDATHQLHALLCLPVAAIEPNQSCLGL